MTTESLTAALAEKVLGWRVRPDRFLVSGRQWIARERFEPTKRVDAAFRLLNALRPADYELRGGADGRCAAKVTVRGIVGEAMSASLPLAICMAIARALGIDVEGLA